MAPSPTPPQLFREVETLKTMIESNENPLSKEALLNRKKLGQVLEQLLLTDLDYALDKKVEQDLWNVVYRSHITALQSKAKESKNMSHNQQSQLCLTLESASGFYLQLLQKLAGSNDIDILCHPGDNSFGIAPAWKAPKSCNKSSLLYICQHCMIHLGDIARYRSQSLQAETFYRHAIDLIPSDGHPYNQLAILEAASGEKLSTVFFYVRSLAVQHPFPLAATNLQILFVKMISDSPASLDTKMRMSAFEFISAFLQLNALVHVGTDFVRAEKTLSQLTSSIPALVIAEKLETWQLLQMISICMFTLGQAWSGLGSSPVHETSNPLEESEKTIYDALSVDEKLSVKITLELIACMLNAFLLPIHAVLDLKESQDYFSLPAIKVVLDWLLHHQTHFKVLQDNAFSKKPQIWHGLCKLMNDLESQEDDVIEADNVPLPEDWDLQCFLPLQAAHKGLSFQSRNQKILTEKEASRLRSKKLQKLVFQLSELNFEGNPLLTITQTEDGKHCYKATQTPVASEQALFEQMKELCIASNPQSSFVSSAVKGEGIKLKKEELRKITGSSNPKITSRQEVSVPSLQQEVRFQLDSNEMEKTKPKVRIDEKINDPPSVGSVSYPLQISRERKAGRQNVALQAILQQRALNYNRPKESNLPKSNDNEESRTWPSYNSSTIVPTDQNPLNSHVKKAPPDPNFIPHFAPKPSESNYMVQLNPSLQSTSSMTQRVPLNSQGVSPFANNSKMMWNYSLNYPLASTTNRDQISSSNQGLSSLPSSQTTHNYLMQQQLLNQHREREKALQEMSGSSGNFSSENQDMGGHLPIVNHQSMPYSHHTSGSLLQDQRHEPHLSSLSTNPMSFPMGGTRPPSMVYPNYKIPMAQPLKEPQRSFPKPNQQSFMPGMSGGEVNSGQLPLSSMMNPNSATSTNTDQSANTYSLFNSPWSSGLTSQSTSNNESLPQGGYKSNTNMDNFMSHNRNQHMWSGPGPTPLERLLEQQKKRRDGNNQ